MSSSCKIMNLKTKQRVCIEFFFWLEKTSREMIVLLKKSLGDKFLNNSSIKTLGDKCLSNSSVRKWHKEFKDGRNSVHDAPQCGMPRTLVTEINTNTIARTFASPFNMLKMSINQILTMKYVCSS